jgi:carbon-monoxide dehydrogenase large subunit
MHLNTMTTRFGSGQAVQRLEDDQLLKGAGVYTSDVVPVGQTHICFFRSPYAHARILNIDTSVAQSMPGVHLVVTGKELVDAGIKPMPRPMNFTRADGSAAASADRRILASDRVRYAGEAIAAVVAMRWRRLQLSLKNCHAL